MMMILMIWMVPLLDRVDAMVAEPVDCSPRAQEDAVDDNMPVND